MEQPCSSNEEVVRQPVTKLPTELWLRILGFCNADTRKALAQSHGRFSDLLVNCMIDICRVSGRTLPSKNFLQYATDYGLQFNLNDILDYDPFGPDVFDHCFKQTNRLQSLYIKGDRGNDKNVIALEPVPHRTPLAEGQSVLYDSFIKIDLDLHMIGVPLWLMDRFSPRIVVTVESLHLEEGSRIIAFGKLSHGLERAMSFAFDSCRIWESDTKREVPEKSGVEGRDFEEEFDCEGYGGTGMRFVDFEVHLIGWVVLKRIRIKIELPNEETIDRMRRQLDTDSGDEDDIT